MGGGGPDQVTQVTKSEPYGQWGPMSDYVAQLSRGLMQTQIENPGAYWGGIRPYVNAYTHQGVYNPESANMGLSPYSRIAGLDPLQSSMLDVVRGFAGMRNDTPEGMAMSSASGTPFLMNQYLLKQLGFDPNTGQMSGGTRTYTDASGKTTKMTNDQLMNQLIGDYGNQIWKSSQGGNLDPTGQFGAASGELGKNISGSYIDLISKFAQPTQPGGAANPHGDTIAGKYLTQAQNFNPGGSLQDTVSGKYLTPESNPYLKKYADAAIRPIQDQYDQIAAQTNTTANQAGRYGGSAWALMQAENAKNAARQIGDTSAGIYAPAYEQERGRQMQGTGLLGDLWKGERGNQMTADAIQQQLYDAERQRQMQAMQTPFNMRQGERGYQEQANQQGLGLVNMLSGLQGQNLDRLAQTVPGLWDWAVNVSSFGNEAQKYKQNLLNDEMTRFYEGLNLPFNLMSNWGGLATTGGKIGGSMTQTSPYQGAGFGEQLMGTGLNVGSLLAQLKGANIL